MLKKISETSNHAGFLGKVRSFDLFSFKWKANAI